MCWKATNAVGQHRNAIVVSGLHKPWSKAANWFANDVVYLAKDRVGRLSLAHRHYTPELRKLPVFRECSPILVDGHHGRFLRVVASCNSGGRVLCELVEEALLLSFCVDKGIEQGQRRGIQRQRIVWVAHGFRQASTAITDPQRNSAGASSVTYRTLPMRRFVSYAPTTTTSSPLSPSVRSALCVDRTPTPQETLH